MYTIMIADDEAIECRGLEMLVQENIKDIKILPSVYNGTDLIKSVQEYDPDLILVDINMPGLNGLEAMEIIRMRSERTKIIICTAYNDFEYAQRAISLGAVDYLLKPVKREVLIKTLSKVLRVIERERSSVLQEQKKAESFQKMQEVAGREVISSIILGTPRQEELNIWLETMDHTYWGGVFAAGDFQNKVKGEELETARAIAGDTLKGYCTFLTKIYDNMLILFFFPGEVVGKENYKEWITVLLERYRTLVEKKMGGTMRFGVSRWRYDFEEMTKAFSEAVAAVHGASPGKICFFEGKYNAANVHKSTEQFIRKLSERIKAKDWDASAALIQWQLTVWEKSGCNKREEIVLTALLLQHCSKAVAGYSIYSWHQIITAFAPLEDTEDRKNIALQFLKKLEILEEEADGRMIYINQAAAYIEKNYNKDLSLEDMAVQLGISPFYLSRLLTQKLKTGFVELLTSARINEAVAMIETENTVIRNISNSVGYQSSTYFYKVFKKNTGMTIGEMRDLLLR
ncbi:MAG: response regulator [Eubacteriales bacterium]|nr:response regulator [Eubacteriales bacterium]